MGLSLDFSMDERQKKIAVLAGIGAAILLVVFVFFAMRGPSYDTTHLKNLENSGLAANAKDLEKLAPLLNHPDDKVRQRVAGYFTGAPPAVVSVAVRHSRGMDPRARRILESRYVENSPAEAVAYLAAELGGGRDGEILNLIGNAKTPDAVPYILEVIENNPDETVRTAGTNAIATNEFLQTDQTRQSLQRIIDNNKLSHRDRSHALRAQRAMSGKPYNASDGIKMGFAGPVPPGFGGGGSGGGNRPGS